MLKPQNKQTNYQSNNEGASTYNTIETPFSVGVGLYVYHSTRSKKFAKFLHKLWQDYWYKERYCGEYNWKELYWLSMSQRFLQLIDSTDLKISTVDGKDQLHGTAIAVHQQ